MARSISRLPDRDPRGTNSCIFIKLIKGWSGPSIDDPTVAIFLKRSTMDRSIITVDHFDQTVTPKSCINRGVLQCFKHSSWKSKKLIYLDTSPLESLDPIVFYTHYRTFGALEIEIWPCSLVEIDVWTHDRVLRHIWQLIGLVVLIWSLIVVSGSGFC